MADVAAIAVNKGQLIVDDCDEQKQIAEDLDDLLKTACSPDSAMTDEILDDSPKTPASFSTDESPKTANDLKSEITVDVSPDAIESENIDDSEQNNSPKKERVLTPAQLNSTGRSTTPRPLSPLPKARTPNPSPKVATKVQVNEPANDSATCPKKDGPDSQLVKTPCPKVVEENEENIENDINVHMFPTPCPKVVEEDEENIENDINVHMPPTPAAMLDANSGDKNEEQFLQQQLAGMTISPPVVVVVESMEQHLLEHQDPQPKSSPSPKSNCPTVRETTTNAQPAREAIANAQPTRNGGFCSII